MNTDTKIHYSFKDATTTRVRLGAGGKVVGYIRRIGPKAYQYKPIGAAPGQVFETENAVRLSLESAS